MKLTRKQKAFADHLINNPKDSATTAAATTYDVSTRKSAEVIASENLSRPAIQLYLEEHIDKAKYRVVELIDSEKESIALQASEAVLDRALGKATQRLEQHATTVNISLDLSNITSDQKT